jgi:hypothetical protein
MLLGDKLSLDFIRDPGPDTRAEKLKVPCPEGSPVSRVRFGEGKWYGSP